MKVPRAGQIIHTEENSIFEDRRKNAKLKNISHKKESQERRKQRFNTSENWYLRASCSLVEIR